MNSNELTREKDIH